MAISAPPPLSAPFASVLAAGRRQFNARVAEARRRAPGFDTAAYAAVLRESVDPVVAATEAVAPACTSAVAMAACDVALALCAHGLAGPGGRCAPLARAWSVVFPRLAVLIAQAPAQVLGALSNAAVHLDGVTGVRVDDWLDDLAALGPRAGSVAELLGLGTLLAWRAGMAHFRAGALRAADALPPALALAALGAPAGADWPDWRARLAADPWASPLPRREAGWQVGAFTGFGGRFAQPPQAHAWAEGFAVRSGDRHFLALADAWGAVILPATEAEFSAASAQRAAATPAPRVQGDHLVFADRRCPLGLPAEGLCVVAGAHGVAVTSPFTHTLWLLPP